MDEYSSTNDPLLELALVERIESARARQQEGQARKAEAVERTTKAALTEQRELRTARERQRQLSDFLNQPGSGGANSLVFEVVRNEEGVA